MGVGLPFGVGRQGGLPGQAGHRAPRRWFVRYERDGVRHRGPPQLPVLVVISLNGGWTGDPEKERPGRELGYTRFDKMAEALGGHGEYVEKPDDIRPALERAMAEVDSGTAGARQRRHRLARPSHNSRIHRIRDIASILCDLRRAG